MNPPLAKPEPASLYKGPLSGRLHDTVQIERLADRCTGFYTTAAAEPVAPLTYPPTSGAAGPRTIGFPAHFLFSAKFLTMVKQKNVLAAIQTLGSRPRVY
jgi:hypothetical protein